MNKLLTILTGAALLVLFILYSTTYTVAYHELAVVTRFGELHEVRTTPGLSLKLPFFADRVSKFDTRLQMVESPMKSVQTADDEQLVIRTFYMWRIDADDPDAAEQFYRSFPSIDVARSELAADLEDAMSVLGRYTFDELFGDQSRIDEAEREMLEALRSRRSGQGIDGHFVGVSNVLFPPTTTQAVLTRMQATRESMARNERIKGQAEATAIESELLTKLGKMRAFARQRAAEIRADASTQSAEYIQQMDQESELAIFLSWLDTVEQALSRNTTFVFDAAFNAPFHLMNIASDVDDHGIPVPRSRLAQEPPEQPLDEDENFDELMAAFAQYLQANGYPGTNPEDHVEADGDADDNAADGAGNE